MTPRLILVLLVGLGWTQLNSVAAVTHEYLFIGHPRADGPGEIVQREVERIDYSAYDLLLLGGGPDVAGNRHAKNGRLSRRGL